MFFTVIIYKLNGKYFVTLSGLSSPDDFEKEDEEGRLERRIAAPWEKEEDDPDDVEEKKTSRAEERRKRKSMKIKNKEKIGNIDINVLQRELCK